jgi:hypothetical protein
MYIASIDRTNVSCLLEDKLIIYDTPVYYIGSSDSSSGQHAAISQAMTLGGLTMLE